MDARTRQFLSQQRVGHLATADASGAPHVIPVCFAVADDTVYIALDEKPKRSEPLRLRRVRNILENPRVALVTDVYDDHDWSRLGYVLVRGVARLVSGGDEHTRAVAALRSKYAQYRAMRLEDRPLIAVAISSTTGWGELGD